MERVQNVTIATFVANSALAGQKRKRDRRPLNCAYCRSRKSSCDRKQPCGNCVKHSVGRTCTYDASERSSDYSTTRPLSNPHPSTTSSPLLPTPTMAQSRAESRMERLERLVESLSAKVDATKNEDVDDDVRPGPDGGQQHHPQSRAIDDRNVEQGRAYLTKTNVHSQGGLYVKNPGEIYYIGKTGWCVVLDDKKIIFTDPRFADAWSDLRDLIKRYKGWRSEPLLHCAMTPPAPSDIHATLLSMVPEREHCEVLVNRFLLTFNATHPIVDGPTLQTEISQFWVSRNAASTMWLGVFLAVIAVGHQLPVTASTASTLSSSRVQGEHLMSSVKSLLFASVTSTRRPDVNCLQLLLLLVLSQSLELTHVDGNDTKHGLLSLANRVVFTMGLHRDPVLSRMISGAEAQLRRKLWSTYKFLDFEHSMQSGMPFLLRESDSDVQEPDATGSTWPDYQTWLSLAIPIWAEVIQLSHSTKARVSTTQLLEIEARMYALELPSMESSTAMSPEEIISVAVQRAVLECCYHRVMISFHGPLVGDSPALVRARSRDIVVKAALGILANQVLLDDIIEKNASQTTASAWRHLATSLLHCNSWYACEYILVLIQNGHIPRSSQCQGQRLDSSLLLTTLHRLQPLLEKTLAFCPRLIKINMIFNALLTSVEERLRLCGELGVDKIDIDSAQAEPALDVMKAAMELSLAKGKEAIAQALTTDDPPAALCEAAVEGSTVYSDTQAPMSGGAGLLAGEIDINDWSIDSALFPSLDPGMAWWGTSPLLADAEWNPQSWIDGPGAATL